MGEFYRPPEQQVEQQSKPEQQAAMEQRINQAEPPNQLSPNYQIEHKDAAALTEAKELPQPQNSDIGAQAQDTPQYNQGTYNDCALQSARMVEAKQLGKDPGLDAYKSEAYKQGNYTEAGVKNMEKFSDQINERPGLEASYKEGANLDEVKSNLDQGKSVIAGVDAVKFYPEHEWPPNAAGKHALVVTGADKGPDGEYNITVNDPNDQTANKVVPEKLFNEAWSGFDNRMIVVEKSGGKA